MLDTLNQYDHDLMLWLNYDGGAFLDNFWFAVTSIPSWIPLYVVILAVLFHESERNHSWKQAVSIVIFTVLIILVADQLTSGLIKPWVQRPRPSHQEGIMEYLHYVRDYRGGAYGFCSSHAANSFALCTWISLLFRRHHLWCTMIAFALLNCYSRIYVGVHYPGDIIVGSLIGILCGWLGFLGYYRTSIHFNIDLCGKVSSLPITCTFWISILTFFIYSSIIS